MSQSSQDDTAGPLDLARETHAKSTRRFLIPLFGLVAIYSIGLSTSMSLRLVIPETSRGLYSLIFGLFLTWWVGIDRHAREFSVPFEFDVLVLVAWPLMVPYYLHRTRGWKGIMFGLGFLGLWILPMVIAAIAAAFLYR